MRPRDKILWALLIASLAAYGVQQRGCELVDIVPTPKVESVHAVIVHETGDREPWLGSLVVLLRQADHTPNTFDILDDDQLPTKVSSAIGTALTSTPLPALFLLDGDTLIYSRSIVPTETVASITESIKGVTQ